MFDSWMKNLIQKLIQLAFNCLDKPIKNSDQKVFNDWESE